MTDQAGQQEVAIKGCSAGTFSMKSLASSMVHKSAPTATSATPAKPSRFMAAVKRSGVASGPNWPRKAGATMATTRSPRRMALMSWKIWPLSTIAPKGQFTRHIPQETHLS